MGKVVRREQYFDHETLNLAEQLARKGFPPDHYVELYKKDRLNRTTSVTKWIVWEEEDNSSSASVTQHDANKKSA